MNILVYGAGPLGSLFAVRLQEAGHKVSLLARGQRLADLRQHGVVLIEARSGRQSVTQVPLVEHLDSNEAYDLALVILRKNHVTETLPVLAANPNIPTVLFLMNNAAGPEEMVNALGKERVMIGFPISAGYFEGYAVRYLGGSAQQKAVIPIGEVDGLTRPRTQQVADALRSMAGYEVEIRKDMDAWLKTHVALLFPSLAPAFYAAGCDRQRLVNTRDLLVLGVRAIREGFRILRDHGVPITPARLRQFEWLPEPVLVAFLQRLLARDEMEVALAGHARAARDEVQHLVDEFLALNTSRLPTPAIDALYPYLRAETEPMNEGSAAVPMDWSGVWVGVTALAAALGSMFLIGGLLISRSRKREKT
jgi:2-dehydropantoate 2-reductase